MRTTGLIGLGLVAALMGASPARAAAPEPTTDVTAEPAAAAPEQVEKSARTLTEALRSARPVLLELAALQTEPATAEPPKRRVGPWLKRRWWIPVLAAVAVGLAVQDDSPDGDEGEDGD